MYLQCVSAAQKSLSGHRTPRSSQFLHEAKPREIIMPRVEQEIPSYYICPITKQVMRQPMMTRWGVCFERHAVIQWLEQGQRFCPVTQNAMSPRDLVPNTKLQNQINAFCQTESRHCRSLRARRSRSEDGVLLHGLELAASEKIWRPTAIHVGCLDRYRKASY